MKNQLTYLIALTLGALLWTGCKTGGAYLPKNVSKYDYENQSNLVLLDKGAQRSITSAGPIQTRVLSDGRLEVIANLRNRENRRIQVDVSCVFKDEQGFPTNDEAVWRTIFLDENAQEGVRFVSMNDAARKFTVRVRESR